MGQQGVFRLFVVLTVLFMVLSNGGSARGGQEPPPVGGVLPDLNLPIPENPGERQYLGLSGKGTFKLPKIKADVVIVEIFSMYCPYCQREAPAVNELYQLIQKDEQARDRVRLIGIGAGNSPFEVDVFRSTYGVPFPLFPDADFAVHNALGKVRTPYFIAFKINKDGTHKVIHSKVGSFGDPEQFLRAILKDSGLDQGA